MIDHEITPRVEALTKTACEVQKSCEYYESCENLDSKRRRSPFLLFPVKCLGVTCSRSVSIVLSKGTLYQWCVCMSVVLYNIHYTANTWLLRVSLDEKEFFEFMLEQYFSIGLINVQMLFTRTYFAINWCYLGSKITSQKILYPKKELKRIVVFQLLLKWKDFKMIKSG